MVIKYFGVVGALLMLQTILLTQFNLFRPQRGGETNYDQIGPYCIHNDLSPEERNRMLGEMREFLWEHWQGRQTGRVKAVFYTIEGDPTFSTFFIEQDEKSRFRVRVTSESTTTLGLRKGQKPRRKTNEETYDILERVEDVRGQDPATAPALPESEKRPSSTYRLRLKNASPRVGQRSVLIM